MRKFVFEMALSAHKTRSIYEGQARYILVESDQGLRLQIPAPNFREYVTVEGIHGRFQVEIDSTNKLRSLTKI